MSSDPKPVRTEQSNFLSWDAAWLTGLAWLDRALAEWVRALNEGARSCAVSDGPKTVAAEFQKLAMRWTGHAREEEAAWQRHWPEGGAAWDAHLAEHRRLRGLLEATASTARQQPVDLAHCWTEFTAAFLGHVLRHDHSWAAAALGATVGEGSTAGTRHPPAPAGAAESLIAICLRQQERFGLNYFQTTGEVPPDATGPNNLCLRAFAESGVPIVIAQANSPQLPIVHVNAAFELMTGYRQDEVIGRNCRFLQGNDDQPAERALIRRALQVDEPLTVVLRNYRKDGTLFWNQLNLAPLRNNRGAVTHYIGVQNDVTRLKQLEMSERELVSRWEALFDALPVGVVLVDLLSKRFVFVNHSFSNMLGYGHGDLIGKQPVDIHRPEDFPAVREEFIQMIMGERRLSLNIPFLRQDGSRRFCDVHGIKMNYAGQECLCGIMLDSSERRAIQTELQQTINRLDAVFLANPDIMLTFDSDCRIVDCLPRDDTRFFRPLAEFLGQPVETVLPPAVASLARRCVGEVLASGRMTQADYQLPQPQGTCFYEVRFLPYIERRVLAVVRDVTELRRAELTLKESHADYVSLFETMAQGVIYRDAGGHLLSANAMACKLLGLTPDNLAKAPNWQAVQQDGTPFPDEDQPAMVALRTGLPVENVTMGLRQPGREDLIWLLVSARPEFRPGESSPYRSFGTFTEITKQKQIEDDLKRQTRIQELLLGISSVFINLAADRVEPAIQQALADLGRYFDADRMYIFSGNEDMSVVSNTHEWCAPGVTPQIDSLQATPVESLTAWMGALHRGENYELVDVSSLPPGSPERQLLEPQGITSIITVPLTDQGRCKGFIGLDFVGRKRKSSLAEKRLLRVFAQSLVNVRDRLALQRGLIESQGLLADIAENSGSLIYVKNTDGCYINVNRRWVEFTGCSREKTLGKDDHSLFPPAQAARFQKQDVEVRRSGTLQHYMEEVVVPVGKLFFLTVKFPIRNADGAVVGVAGMSTDISELKRNELLEQKRGEILQALVLAEPLDSIYQRLVGFVENGVPEARCSILILDSDHKCLEVAYAPNLPEYYNAALHGLSASNGSCGIITATNEPHYAEDIRTDASWPPPLREEAARAGLAACWSTPLKTAAGQILGSFVIYRAAPGLPNDEQRRYLSEAGMLTALAIDQAASRRERLARIEAEAVARAHQSFLARMSHEIRTPLNAILGFSHLLLKSFAEDGKARSQVGAIAHSSEHLLGLINDILDFAKIQTGQATLEPVDFSLEQLIKEVVEVFQPRAEAKNLAFVFTADAKWPPRVRGDRLKLRQILNNLLENAVKFTAVGRLELAVALQPGATPQVVKLQVAVNDTGPGIPADELPYIFDDFYQGKLGRAVGGTGLGLPITHNLVEQMGGCITVKSRQNEGTQFSFYVVLTRVDQADAPPLLQPAGNDRSLEMEAPGPVLTPGQVVAALPPPLLQALADAVAQGKMRDFRRLLSKQSALDPVLQKALDRLAEHYDYATLNRLLNLPSPPSTK